jgi:hypothetical protein
VVVHEWIIWHVIVDDVADPWYVETSGGNIGCDEYVDPSLAEGLGHGISLALGHVTVQRFSVDIVSGECFG